MVAAEKNVIFERQRAGWLIYTRCSKRLHQCRANNDDIAHPLMLYYLIKQHYKDGIALTKFVKYKTVTKDKL